MSAYDDAVAYLDAEVHPRCDYEIYSDMRDIVDEMEDENAKLRDFGMCALTVLMRNEPKWVWGGLLEQARGLGIEVDE